MTEPVLFFSFTADASYSLLYLLCGGGILGATAIYVAVTLL